MDKQILKHKQIEIANAMSELYNATQNLLVDVITEMTEDERKKLKNYYIDDFQFITKITPAGYVSKDGDGDVFDNPFEYLTQEQQKDIIDFVMFNIWHI